jgi:hypothetical protein
MEEHITCQLTETSIMRIYKLSATIKMEKNIILHFFLLSPKYLVQNMVLREIFGPKKDKVTGYWR